MSPTISVYPRKRWSAGGPPAVLPWLKRPDALDEIARWRDELLIGGSPQVLELELRRLERDKQLEEIKQLRSSRTTQWITPAALATLVPLLAGLAVWIFGELKQLNEGYRALGAVQTLEKDRAALEERKNGLNLEVMALIAQKTDYLAQANQLKTEAEQLRAASVARQEALDRLYLRAKFAAAETTYALTHIRGLGEGPSRSQLAALRPQLNSLPEEASKSINEVIERYQFSMEIVEITEKTLQPLTQAVEAIPASAWTHELQPMPAGAVLANRNIMITSDHRRGYDVDASRWLTAEEAKKARGLSSE